MHTQQHESAHPQAAQGLDMGMDMGLPMGHGTSARMGSAAPPPPLNLNGRQDAPIQRQCVHYKTVKEDDESFTTHKAAVLSVVSKIDSLVAQARKISLNWKDLLEDGEKHVKGWATTAKKYFDDPSQTPDFIHARFGYSIETLACKQLSGTEDGLTVSLQVAKGATRPDIVLSKNDKEVAWIDITSSDSKGHIFGKDGSGWKTKPFVVEVLYDPLNLKEVLEGSNDPIFKAVGGFMAQKNQIRYQEEEKVRVTLRDNLINFRDTNEWTTGTGNATTKKNATKDFLKNQMKMDLGDNVKKSTKGALALADINNGPFGFNRDKVGTETQSAKKWVTDTADSEVKKRVGELEVQKLKDLSVALKNYSSIKVVNEFLEKALSAPSSDLVLKGIAIKAGIEYFDKVKSALIQLRMLNKDMRAKEAILRLTQLVLKFPDKMDFKAFQGWVEVAMKEISASELLVKTIVAYEKFQEYLEKKQKLGSKPTEKEILLYKQLSGTLKDNGPIQEVISYMSMNPIQQPVFQAPQFNLQVSSMGSNLMGSNQMGSNQKNDKMELE